MTTNDKPSKNDFNPASCETNVTGSTGLNVLSLFDYYHTKNWVFKI